MGMVDGTMLGDTPPRKLDPRSLTSEERAIVDNCALYYRRCNNDEPAIDGETVTWAYVEGLEKAEPFIILARRAIFGEPASEPAKVETEWHPCKNCGQLTLESPDRPLYNDHLCQYPCEPAKVECPNCGELTTYPHGFKWDGEDHYRCSKPAQPEIAALWEKIERRRLAQVDFVNDEIEYVKEIEELRRRLDEKDAVPRLANEMEVAS